MTMTRKMIWGLAVLLGSSLMAPAFADEADKAIGVWLRPNKGWHVEFAMCGAELCGEIISGEGVDKKTGEPVVGIQMLYGLVKDGPDRWKGKMYNPGDGGTYKGKVTVLSDDEIQMAGCMMGFICRAEKWSRVVEAAPMDDAEDAADDMIDEAEDAVDDMMDEAEEAAEDILEEATDE